MITSQSSFGMVPSDILIAGAISAGIDDIKANPYLLDYCFNFYSTDTLTAKYYGDAAKQRAKQWFLNTDIYVSMGYRQDDPKFPIVAITLQQAIEDYSTLGDVNYDTVEDVDPQEVSVSPQIVLGPFTPLYYDSTTGIVTLPTGITNENVFIGQILTDTVNNIGYPITNVDSANNTVTIASGITTADFTNCFIAPMNTFYVASLESCLFKHVYNIKCLVQNEPEYTLYLSTVITFILLRYKEILLEARGFDRSTVNVGGLYHWDQLGVENTFGQDITLTGFIRQYWPKVISPKIEGFKIDGIKVIGGGVSPASLIPYVNLQGWGMENDP